MRNLRLKRKAEARLHESFIVRWLFNTYSLNIWNVQDVHCCGFTLIGEIFLLQHKSLHSYVRNLSMSNSKTVTTLSSPMKAGSVSRQWRRSSETGLLFCHQQEQRWSMIREASPFPNLLSNSFDTPLGGFLICKKWGQTHN